MALLSADARGTHRQSRRHGPAGSHEGRHRRAGAHRQPAADRCAARRAVRGCRGTASRRADDARRDREQLVDPATLPGARGSGRPRGDSAGSQRCDDRRQSAAAAALLVLPQRALPCRARPGRPRGIAVRRDLRQREDDDGARLDAGHGAARLRRARSRGRQVGAAARDPAERFPAAAGFQSRRGTRPSATTRC